MFMTCITFQGAFSLSFCSFLNMHNMLMVLPSYCFFKQNPKSSPGIDDHRVLGSYSLVSLSLPSCKSRNSEDEPVTLLPFHFPIKTIPTKISLREGELSTEGSAQLQRGGESTQSFLPALCLPPSNPKEKPILFPSRGLQGAKLISFSH